MEDKKGRKELKKQNIQCLRIIGCFGVLATHLSQQVTWNNAFTHIASYGSKGVYLFFLISGFVTFLSLEKIEDLHCMKYYKGRMVRLLPLYYSVMLYWFVMHQYIWKDTPGNSYLKWFRYVFMVNSTLPADDHFWVNVGTTWTMSSFALFYLFVPLIKKICKSFQQSLILWAVLFMLMEVLTVFCGVDEEMSVCCLHYFVFGIVTYYAVCEGGKKLSFYILLCEVVSLLMLMRGALWDNTFWLMEFSIFLVTTMDFAIPNGVVSKVIDILDKYTFDVYLIHPIFLGINFISLFDENLGKVTSCVILTAVTSVLVHNLIEKPIQNFFRRRLQKIEKI